MSKEKILETLERSNCPEELNSLRDVNSNFSTLSIDLAGALVQDKSIYTDEDFYKSISQLKLNFCLERLNRIIEIKLNLIDHGIEGFAQLNSNEVNSHNTAQNDKISDTKEDIGLEDLSSTFSSALSNRDLHSLKVSLLNLLLDNSKPIDKLEKLLFLIKEKCPDVFETYIEDRFIEPMNQDKSHWVVSYFHEQNLSLESNFSSERYEHLLEVREYLRIKGEPSFQFIEATKKKKYTSQNGTSGHTKSSSTSEPKQDKESNYNTSSSWIDEVIDMLVDSLRKIKDASCELIEKIKSKLK